MLTISNIRPTVNVYGLNGKAIEDNVSMPDIFKAPIRPDIVSQVYKLLAKNKRQPYAVSKSAGEQTSAESWGTGRALARIPRVKGGGTSRSGQGAFGNMCRGGRMYAPTKIWRKWHFKANLNEKRYAVCSAIAASGIPSLVVARGHKVSKVPEMPFVVSDSVENIIKTKEAIAALKELGAYDDVERVKDSRKIRAGKGKMRNRKYVKRRGPLIIYKNEFAKGFRNISGVEMVDVRNLSVLALAPGAHLGRFVIWTKSAFQYLDELFGTYSNPTQLKNNFYLPRPMMENPDFNRIIDSEEIQSKISPPEFKPTDIYVRKVNPLKNSKLMIELNPYHTELAKNMEKSREDRQRMEHELKEALSEKHKKLLDAE